MAVNPLLLPPVALGVTYILLRSFYLSLMDVGLGEAINFICQNVDNSNAFALPSVGKLLTYW